MSNYISIYSSKIAENLIKNYELFAKNYETSFSNLAEKNLVDVARKTESEVLGSGKSYKLILDFFDSSASHYLKSDIIKTLVVYMVKKLL